jgi:DNA-binding NarL/FixJ family response regulator
VVYRALLCEERPLISAGLRAIFESARDIEVVAVTHDLREMAGLVRGLAPDAVLIGMPRVDGNAVATLRDITEQADGSPRPNVLLLVEQEDSDYLRKAIQGGVRGIVRTDASVAELVRAARDIALGHAVLPPSVTGALLSEAVARWPRRQAVTSAPTAPQLAALTPRERHVLELIALGKSNAEIADFLRISETTVRSHVHHMLTKLNQRGRAQAVAFGYRHGIVRAPGLAQDRADARTWMAGLTA